MKNFYDVLGVLKEATADEIKKAYRDLAKKWHPDKNAGSAEAAAMMAEINNAYAVLSDDSKRADYDAGKSDKPVVIGNRRFSVELVKLVSKGDLSDVYLGKASSGKQVAVKLSRSAAVNDLLEREAGVMKTLRPVNSPDSGMHIYYTLFMHQMKIDDGTSRRVANIMGWNSSFYTLEEVMKKFPKGLPIHHVAWMTNRILESLDNVHEKNDIVHTSLLPPHVMVYSGTDKENDNMVHGARIIDWCYSVKSGETPVAISPKYKEWYAPEVLDKSRLTKQTDLYMLGNLMVYMLGGDPTKRVVPAGTPKYMTDFIKKLLEKKRFKRPDSAWEIRSQLKETLETNFGPRKYVPFDIESGT